ncbi:MAG: LysR family transcriptional regulator [Arenibacterium sp.]
MKDVDLNLLIALEALLAERNVTHAARRLGLSQPALSSRLARLRDQFGDPLFVPAQRGVIPTDRALALQDPLRAALDQLRSVVLEQTKFDPATSEATINIAVTDYVQVTVFLPLFAALRREAPGIRLGLRQLDREKLPGQMERGDTDLALLTPSAAPDTLRMRRLFDESYVVILRKGHPAGADALSLETFCALDHVIAAPRGVGFAGQADLALEALGRKRRVVMAVANFLVVPETVATSDLVAVVPRRLVEGRRDGFHMTEPPLHIPGFSIAMVWHERTQPAPEHQWFRDRLHQFEASRATR